MIASSFPIIKTQKFQFRELKIIHNVSKKAQLEVA